MTLVDLDELLFPYLAAHPPVHILVAGLAGFKGRKPAAAADDPVSAHGAGLAALRQVLGSGDVHAGMKDRVILDFGRLRAAANKRSA